MMEEGVASAKAVVYLISSRNNKEASAAGVSKVRR